MTPQEKAFELVAKMEKDFQYFASRKIAIQHALVAVDEIMQAPFENTYLELVPDDAPDSDWFWDTFREYWNEVKQEIEKL